MGDFIFDFLDRSQQRGAQTGFDVTGAVSVSCLEIYNEQIRDILAPFMDGGGLGGGASRGSFVTPRKGMGNAATHQGRASTVAPKSARAPPTASTGGVFTKGAKALGVKSAAERAGNLKIRETASKGKSSAHMFSLTCKGG